MYVGLWSRIEALERDDVTRALGEGTATFLVDGAVAGAWRHEDGRVTLDPWRRLDRATRRALGEEAERLAAFHA